MELDCWFVGIITCFSLQQRDQNSLERQTSKQKCEFSSHYIVHNNNNTELHSGLSISAIYLNTIIIEKSLLNYYLTADIASVGLLNL